jgi:hypothetical protein
MEEGWERTSTFPTLFSFERAVKYIDSPQFAWIVSVEVPMHNQGPFPLGGLGGPELGVLCFAAGIALVVAIFYFLTLQTALTRVCPRNRLMEPGLVWLGLIPLFNIIWSFFIAIWVTDSLRNEFRDQRRDDGTDYGKGIGLANAILGAIMFPLEFLSGLNVIIAPVGLAALVLFIIFWVKISGYSARLAARARYPDDDDRGHGRRDDYPDDRFDDYPRRDPQPPPSDAIRPEDQGHYRGSP